MSAHALLKEIQAAAVDASEPIANVLRKCAVLATELKNDELRDWVFKELNGYSGDDQLPGYRIVPAPAYVSLAGPFGSGYRNVVVPALLLPKNLRDYAELVKLRQPIAALAELAAKDAKETGELVFPWPGNLTALMQKEDKFNGHVIYDARQSMSSAALTGLVDSVRNRVLEFSLKLEPEIPATPAGGGASNPAATQAAHQLFQTIILGDHTGNIANASPGAIQTTTVIEQGDLAGLLKALTDSGVPPAEIEALEAAIVEEREIAGMGPKAGRWLAKATGAVAAGSWTLAKGVTIATITKLVLAYFGIG